MSAWAVSSAHIDALTDAAMQAGDGLIWEHEGVTHHIADATPQGMGQLLRNTNVESLMARYGNTAYANECGSYHYRGDPTQPVAWPTILSAIACYEYQSCEHAGWATSEAALFCAALRTAAEYETGGADPLNFGDPGYYWGIDEHAQYRRQKPHHAT